MIDRWLIYDDQALKSRLILTVGASMLGKLLGFLRIQQIAATLGVSLYSDVLLIALQVVWLLETVLISSAVVPVIVSRIYQIDTNQGGEAAIRLYLHAALVCTVISVLGVGVALLFSKDLAGLIAPGIEEEGVALFSTLLLVSAATPLALMLAHFLGLVNRFLNNGVWYSVPQIITNTVAICALIAGFTLGGAAMGAHWMMVGMGIGAFLVCAMQFWVIPKKPRNRLLKELRRGIIPVLRLEGARAYWGGVGALALVAFVNELYIYIDFFFASSLEAGNVSAMGFASRLATLTNMILVGSAFVILEPRWANALATEGEKAWQSIVRPDAISLLALVAAPWALLYVYASDVTALIYNSDEFTYTNREKINALTRVFAFGMVALAFNLITTRAVVIAHRQKWLFIISLTILPLKLAMSAYLIEPYGVMGLASATILAIAAQALGNIAVLTLTSVNIGLRLLDIIKLGVTFGAAVSTAMALFPFLGGSLLGLVTAGFIISMLVLLVGTLCGFSYTGFIKQSIRRN